MPIYLIWVVFRHSWSTLYSCGDDLTREQILSFALHKLRNGPRIPKTEENSGIRAALKRRAADLAALSVCVLFDFTELHSSQRIQAELIASHMRVVWSMNERREYVIAGYPCEPILAVAALHHWHQVQEKRYDTLSVMRDAVIARQIAKGEKGELIARLILILAFHQALRLPNPKNALLLPVGSVTVKDFLSALLPSDSPAAARFWTMSHGGNPKAEDVFRKAKVYFTHFVRYNFTPKPRHLWAAVTRGQAIQCSHQEQEIDIILPIVLDSDAQLDEDNISALLVQVKNRVNSTSIFPTATGIGLETPYISILFQLGLQECEGRRNNSTLPHTAKYRIDSWCTRRAFI
jgi:hypothetical protein